MSIAGNNLFSNGEDIYWMDPQSRGAIPVVTRENLVRELGAIQIIEPIVEASPRRQSPVIISTDLWTDVDDVSAIRMLAKAERYGLIDILCVGMSTTLALGPAAVDAMFTAEGRTKIPIGVLTTPYVPSGTPPYQTNMAANNRTIGFYATCRNAVDMIRRTLVASPVPVEFVEIGYHTLLKELLQSVPDSVSPLTGIELVASKISRLWVMGGNFPTGGENNFNRDATAKAASQYAMANWPTPITFVGNEVGSTIISGKYLQYGDPADLLAKARVDHGTVNGSASYDPTLVLAFLLGTAQFGGTSPAFSAKSGTISLDVNSSVSWTYSATGPHEYLIKAGPDEDFVLAIDQLTAPTRITRMFAGKSRTGVRVLGAAQPTLPHKFNAGVDNDNLFAWFHADDLSTLADTNQVLFWEDRRRNLPAFGVSATAPTYAAAKNGKKAVAFNGSQHLVSKLTPELPRTLTIYVKAQFDVAPVADQFLLDFETPDVLSKHLMLQCISGTACRAVHFINQSFSVLDTHGAGAVGTAAWQVFGLNRTDTSIEAHYNNTTNGSAFVSVPNWPSVAVPMTIGRRASSVNGLVGWIHEIRIYAANHNSATRAAVIAELT